MLHLIVRIRDEYDEETGSFIIEDFDLELEHSLVSLSKWESEFEKAFLVPDEKTSEELLGYVRCMILNSDYPETIFDCLTESDLKKINGYIDAKMTATTFSDTKHSSPSREKITSELVYYWMTSYTIPWEAQYWHLNRLFTLIKVFVAKNEKPTKMTAAQHAAKQRELNAERRARYNTSG